MRLLLVTALALLAAGVATAAAPSFAPRSTLASNLPQTLNLRCADLDGDTLPDVIVQAVSGTQQVPLHGRRVPFEGKETNTVTSL